MRAGSGLWDEKARVEIAPFRAISGKMARAYGVGARTTAPWRAAMGAFYRTSAARNGATLTGETPLIWEWFEVVRRS